MSEKLSPPGEKILKELSQPLLEHDASGAFPSSRYLYGTSRQLSLSMLAGEDNVYATLSNTGLITMTPVQGLNPPEYVIEITEECAKKLGKTLVIPVVR